MNEDTKPKVKSYWAVFITLDILGATQSFTWYCDGPKGVSEEKVAEYAKDRTLREHAVRADRPRIAYCSSVKITKKEYIRNKAKPTSSDTKKC